MKGILEAKRQRRRELIDAIRAASPEELEASPERVKAVMLESKSGHRKRLSPPTGVSRFTGGGRL